MLARILAVPVALVLSLAVVAGCGGDGNDDGRPDVVASFYPLQFVADRIAGEHATITTLTQPGVEPHDLELSPRQVAELSDADIAFFESGLQPAVDEAIENSGPEKQLDVAEAIELHEEAEHTEETDEDHAEEDRGHSHEGDPHFWQDPTLLGQVAAKFTTLISEVDPTHAADYRANNDALQADLTALDAEITAGLANCRTRTLVVSHDAFAYFGERYDLQVHAIAGLSPDAEPSPKHLGELADLIETEQITTVFNETLASPRLAKTLADELGIATAVLDPIEGLAAADEDDDYLSLMRANLAAIQKADSCT